MGAKKTWDPADESLAGQPERASADSEVRPGPRPPTLRPHHRTTTQAGPETLKPSSLPIMRRPGAYAAIRAPGRQSRNVTDRPNLPITHRYIYFAGTLGRSTVGVHHGPRRPPQMAEAEDGVILRIVTESDAWNQVVADYVVLDCGRNRLLSEPIRMRLTASRPTDRSRLG